MTIQFIVPVLSSLTLYHVCCCAAFPTPLVNLLSSFRIPSTCSLVWMFISHVPNDPWTFVNLLDLPRVHTRTYGNLGSGGLPLSHYYLHMAENIAVLRMFSDQHQLAWPSCLTRWCVHCARVCAPSIAASSLAAPQGLTFPRSFFESSPSPDPNISAWPVPLT